MAADTCWASSLAAGEPLAGTAPEARRWLLVEARGAWARDVDETLLPADVRDLVHGFDGRVQLIRRPDRRDGEGLAFVADSEAGGTLQRLEALHDLENGERIEGPMFLVCCHGRRDPCCARIGTPVFEALRAHVAVDSVWQSSHLGGHRFAANVLVLPSGILLGRVAPADVPRIATELAAGRIPLEHYRGKTIYPPEAQAADAAVRQQLGLTGLDDVVVLSAENGRVRIANSSGEIEVVVEALPGPLLMESCGKEPAVSTRYSVHW